MFKNIKHLLLTSLVLLISGCGTSSISYQNEQLSLQINKSQVQVHGTQVKQRTENFSPLFITQKLMRLDDGSFIVYEDARTDMQYQFDPTTPRSISIIFDAKRVVKVYYNSFIYGFQVVLKDNRVLNLIASQNFDQELQMVYGMSTEKLNSMLKELDQDAQPAYYKNVINLHNEPTPFMSRVTTWKVNFVPLVIPLRRVGRF